MRTIAAVLLLAVSLLLPAGAWATNGDPKPQLQLQQTPGPAPNSPQEGEIHDLKGPVPVPDMMRYLLPAAAALTLLLIAALLVIVWKRRRRRRPAAPSPDVVALAELDQARVLTGEPLVYAERISTLLRRYIEARFQIPSTRQTTGEFFSRLRHGTTIAEVDIRTHAGNIQECMELCDRAKFAHGSPDQDDMNRMDGAARTFIETTRQAPPPA